MIELGHRLPPLLLCRNSNFGAFDGLLSTPKLQTYGAVAERIGVVDLQTGHGCPKNTFDAYRTARTQTEAALAAVPNVLHLSFRSLFRFTAEAVRNS